MRQLQSTSDLFLIQPIEQQFYSVFLVSMSGWPANLHFQKQQLIFFFYFPLTIHYYLNMLKGRSSSILNKHKQKLVLGRPNPHRQQIQYSHINVQLLEVKPFAVSHNQRASPFRFRRTENFSKNMQPIAKFDLSGSKEKKNVSNEANCSYNKVSQQKSKIVTPSKRTTIQQTQQIVINQGLQQKLMDQIIADQKGHHIIPAQFIKQLLVTINQAGLQTNQKFDKSIQKHNKQCQTSTIDFVQLVQKPTKKSQCFRIQPLYSISQHFTGLRPKERVSQQLDCLLSVNLNKYKQQSSETESDERQDKLKQPSNQNLSYSIHLNKDQQDVVNQKIQMDLPTSLPKIQIYHPYQLQKFKQQHLQLMQKYIHHQPNKIVEMASIFHKAIEEDMFEYADFLKTNRFGITTYITNVNVRSLDILISKDLQQTNKRLIQSEEDLAAKCRVMRDFATRTRQRYDNLLKQMMTAIDKKTQFCRQFVDKVNKWYENYQARSEYLSNLKQSYSQQLFMLHFQLKQIQLKLNPLSAQAITHIIKCSAKRLEKIDQIILIGNSFY